MGFIAWIIVGLVAGWLAGQVMKSGGYGVVEDIILGLLGSVLGRCDLRNSRNLARRRHDRLHNCGICWRGDFGLDYPLTEKSLMCIAVC